MTKMSNFESDQKMPTGPDIQTALEEIAEAWANPEKAEELHRRIMEPSPNDEGLAAIVFVVMNALDDRRTGPKDMAIKKLVALAGLGGPEICEKIKAELGGAK
jgi:hypothetical protein